MGHAIIRPYSTRNSHPDEPDVSYDNDLCRAIRSGDHVYLREQVGSRRRCSPRESRIDTR